MINYAWCAFVDVWSNAPCVSFILRAGRGAYSVEEKAAVGTKQVLRLLNAGGLTRVYIAQDAEAYLVNKLEAACREHGVETVFVPTMRELGKTCGIDVGAACAGVRLKQ